MGSQRADQIKDSLISLQEAAQILEMSQEDVRRLVESRQLIAYQLGDDIVRLSNEQVWRLQSQTRISSAELFPKDRARQRSAQAAVKATFFERIRDFFYFNDFYILTFVVIAALLYLIFSSQ